MSSQPTTPEPSSSAGADPNAERIGVLRRRIDAADEAIIEMVKVRMAASAEVGAIRMANGGPRLVLSREQQIIGRYREALGADGAQLAMLLLRASRGRL